MTGSFSIHCSKCGVNTSVSSNMADILVPTARALERLHARHHELITGKKVADDHA